MIKALAMLALLTLTINTVSAKDTDKPEQKIKVQLLKPLNIQTDTKARARFSDLTPEGIKRGLDKTRLAGVVQKKPISGAYRVKIIWNHLYDSDKKDAKKSILSPPLVSTLKVKKGVITDQKAFTATGDVDSLAVKTQELKKSNQLSEKDEKKKEKVASIPKSNNSASTKGGIGGSAKENTLPDLGSKESYSYKSCVDRISISEGLAYEQSSEITTDESGKLKNSGTCSDTGVTKPLTIAKEACSPKRKGDTLALYEMSSYQDSAGNDLNQSECSATGETVPVTKEYDEACGLSLDFVNLKAYKRVNEIAEIGNETKKLSSCTTDRSVELKLVSSYDGCPVIDNFITGISTQQERYHYLEDGAIHYVSDCINSDLTYTHYETDTGCSPVTDRINDEVTVFTQPAYMLGDAEYYPSSCAPSQGQKKSIIEEPCDPEFDHDYEKKTSTRTTRFYYQTINDEKHYITTCAPSQDIFAHREVTDDCPVRYDAADSKYYISTKTQVLVDGDLVTLRDCDERNPPVPYATSVVKTAGFTDLDIRNDIFSQTIPIGNSNLNFVRSEFSPDPSSNLTSFNLNFDGWTGYSVVVWYKLNGAGYIQALSYNHTPYEMRAVNVEKDFSINLVEGDAIDFYISGTSNTANLLPKPRGSLTVTASWE